MMQNKCSLCHSLGTSRSTCPLNQYSRHIDYNKHYLADLSDMQKGGSIDILTNEPPYLDNIEQLTVDNKNFRKVLYTTPTMQLVLMSLKPGENIGMEIHTGTTQFFRIEEGAGTAILNGIEHALGSGDALVVPPNTEHDVLNTSSKDRLQIYTLYSPPHHPVDRLQKNKPVESDYISE